MSVKAMIDGKLLAACESLGPVRFGMFRVAEEIVRRLLHEESLELGFGNLEQDITYEHLLRTYLSRLEGKKPELLSYPFAGCGISRLERISAGLVRRLRPASVPGTGRYDLFHSFYHPFSPFIQKARITRSITFLDIIPLRMQGYEELQGELKAIVESIVPNFALAISQFSKEDLCDYDKRIDPQRVFVVPLAADKSLFHVNMEESSWLLAKQKYGLPDHYFLSLSGSDKRKNLEHLVRAFDGLVKQQNTGDLHLVMTGNVSLENSLLKDLDIDRRTRSRIVWVRPVEEADLSVVYSRALSFFFMSRYEGFGLPALEAMQCGTPVVTSNATSLPEVVGKAGILLDPDDRDGLSAAMWQLYTDSALRTSLSTLSLRQAETFSWQRTADAYTAVFKQIAGVV